MYDCVHKRSPKTPRSKDEERAHNEVQKEKEKEVSEAFMSYLSLKGPFEDWEKNKETFQHVNVSVNNLLY